MKTKLYFSLFFIFFCFLFVCVGFAQGNFNLEWTSPTGFTGVCSMEKNNSVKEVVCKFNNTYEYYDGNTHVLKYTVPLDTSFGNYTNPNSYSLDYYYSRYNSPVDLNNDGVFDIISTTTYSGSQGYGVKELRIINGANGQLLRLLSYNPSSYVSYIFTDIDGDGYVEYCSTYGSTDVSLYVYSTPAQVSVSDNPVRISDYELKQNYPNPFNPSTTIEYSLRKPSDVNLVVYDITGKIIKTINNGKLNTGTHKHNFNSDGLASGTYFYVIVVDGVSDAKKMILVK